LRLSYELSELLIAAVENERDQVTSSHHPDVIKEFFAVIATLSFLGGRNEQIASGVRYQAAIIWKCDF
jgi:hypothetical protein